MKLHWQYTLEAKTSSVKIFVGKNVRHLPKISSLFTDENLNLQGWSEIIEKNAKNGVVLEATSPWKLF